ncbi:hypothetical protein FISHEDRAFT_28739, partial [Fistulina hepatica ATCC 64428]
NEAHGASVKLQRNALDHTQAQELIQHLRRDNELLTAEVETLLALSAALPTPPTPHPAESQAQQLTLALRQLSDKLSLAESSLVKLTHDLLSAHAEATRARRAEEQAYALAARARGREEDAKAAQRSLERILRAKEEELRMADRAMGAYAELVRGMEGRRSSASHTPPPYHESSGDEADGTDKEKASSMSPLDSLEEGKRGLNRLFVEMSDEHERLEVELARLAGQLEDEQARAVAEAQGAADERELRAAAEGELARLRADDTTAAKMVSRYILPFPRSSSSLYSELATLDSLSARHTATIQTLSAQIEALEERHLAEQERAGRLRTALDELGRDVQREAVGRRREVALRIRLVSREERLRERQRRWVWSVEELLRGDENRVSPHAGQVVQELNEHALKRNDFPMRIVEDACEMLSSLDSTADLKYKDGSDDGALARIIVAENAVRQMVEELQAETTRRMELEVALARGEKAIPVLEPSPSSNVPTKPVLTSPSPLPLVTKSSPSPELPVDLVPVPISPAETLAVAGDILLRQTSDRQKELLESLSDVAHRYDHLQHAFRDCHLALQDLKGLATLVTVDGTSVDAASASSSHIPRISPHVLETAISRLDDYTEDARVELEIRISDEAVLARGFEMLLAVPGALAHQSSANLHFPSPRSPATPIVDSDEDIVEQIGRFTAGTEHSVQRARETFERKLDDIQHDIAVLKRVVHD